MTATKTAVMSFGDLPTGALFTTSKHSQATLFAKTGDATATDADTESYTVTMSADAPTYPL